MNQDANNDGLPQESESPRQPMSPPEVMEPDTANMDKIRDLLFGAQMKNLDKKLSQMNEHFSQEIYEAKAEFKSRLDSFETYVKGELQSLFERLENEQRERGNALAEIATDLKSSAAALDKKIQQLDNSQEKQARELRQQLLDQAKSLSDDIRTKHDEAQTALRKTASGIRHDMVERGVLSSMLTDVALRLNNELSDSLFSKFD